MEFLDVKIAIHLCCKPEQYSSFRLDSIMRDYVHPSPLKLQIWGQDISQWHFIWSGRIIWLKNPWNNSLSFCSSEKNWYDNRRKYPLNNLYVDSSTSVSYNICISWEKKCIQLRHLHFTQNLSNLRHYWFPLLFIRIHNVDHHFRQQSECCSLLIIKLDGMHVGLMDLESILPMPNHRVLNDEKLGYHV